MREEFSNVARYLSVMAREDPLLCAIKDPHHREPNGTIIYNELTFLELNKYCDAVSRYISECKIGRGTRVLLLLKPGLNFLFISFALFKIGAVPIFIDPGMGLKNFLNSVLNSQPEGLIGIPKAQWFSRIFFTYFRNLRVRINVESYKFVQAVDKLLSSEDQNDNFDIAQTGSEELAAILFTSGSTGPPKGVSYEHGVFESQVNLIRDHYDIKRGEIDFPMLPIFALFNPALGMTTIVPEMNPSRPATVDPRKVVEAINQCEVTNSFGSPAIWSRVARYCNGSKINLATMKRILIAGAPVPLPLIENLSKCLPCGAIYTPYGATECLPITSIGSAEIIKETSHLTLQGKGTCVGRPLPGIIVRVIKIHDDSIGVWDDCLELPQGSIGEIIVKGSVVTKEYDALKEHTELAKINESNSIWHRTGDLGYNDNEDRLWFCGRKVERVPTAQGELYTDCCESIYNQHPEVFRTALIGLGESNELIPAIVVEPEKGNFPNRASHRKRLITELKALGEDYQMTRGIDRFFIQKSLPVDIRHNAKIHRLTLARKYNLSSPI